MSRLVLCRSSCLPACLPLELALKEFSFLFFFLFLQSTLVRSTVRTVQIVWILRKACAKKGVCKIDFDTSMLHIIAGKKSAAYDGALFAILIPFLPIFLFLIVVWAFSACKTGRGNKERNDTCGDVLPFPLNSFIPLHVSPSGSGAKTRNQGRGNKNNTGQ